MMASYIKCPNRRKTFDERGQRQYVRSVLQALGTCRTREIAHRKYDDEIVDTAIIVFYTYDCSLQQLIEASSQRRSLSCALCVVLRSHLTLKRASNDSK